jgi:hypothetical protein
VAWPDVDKVCDRPQSGFPGLVAWKNLGDVAPRSVQLDWDVEVLMDVVRLGNMSSARANKPLKQTTLLRSMDDLLDSKQRLTWIVSTHQAPMEP